MSRKIKKLSKRYSQKRFRNSARRVHSRNLRKTIHRGGYML